MPTPRLSNPHDNSPASLRRAILNLNEAVREVYALASGTPVLNDENQIVRNDDENVVRVEL